MKSASYVSKSRVMRILLYVTITYKMFDIMFVHEIHSTYQVQILVNFSHQFVIRHRIIQLNVCNFSP